MNAQTPERPKLCIFVMILLGLTNCSPEKSDDDDVILPVTPNKEVLYTFSAKYPDARAVCWDMENEFYIARFTNISVPVNAWFSEAGEWFLSVREHSSAYTPEAFYRSSYAEWDIEKINLLERKGMDMVYVVSVKQNSRIVHLYYSQYGDFIKAMPAISNYAYSPVVIPQEIRRALSRLFDSPGIIDFWTDELAVNVALHDNGAYCLAVFTFAYEWTCTFRDITRSELKPGIWEKFQLSDYGVYTVRQFRSMQNETGISYLFYFQDNEKKSNILFIKENGNFDCVISY